jgi:hypothetical protein
MPDRASSSRFPVMASETTLVWLYWMVLLASLAVMARASFDFGITFDEPLMRDYGEWIYRFYASGFTDMTLFEHHDVFLYGGLFDLTSTLFGKFLPLGAWDSRHLVNSIVGWVGVLYAARLAKREFGTWAGIIAAGLLATSPRYFGHCMNNSKDIPFASAYLATLYYLLPLVRTLPLVSYVALAKFVLAAAIAVNVRIAGLLPMAYLGFFASTSCVARPWIGIRKALAMFLTLAAAFGVSLLLGSVAWPWSLGAPIVRPFRALEYMSHFSWSGHMLFAGGSVWARAVPWNYIPQWFAITTPPAVVAGLLLALVAFRARGQSTKTMGVLALAIAFPVAYAIVRQATLYDAERHFLFVYPPLVVIAAGAWASIFASAVSHRTKLYVSGVAFAVLVVEPVAYCVRAHPNEYVYFNPFVGGVKGAHRDYEVDYWGNCVREATEWVFAHRGAHRPTIIGSNRGWVHEFLPNDPTFEYSQENVGHFYVHHLRYDGEIARLDTLTSGEAPLHIVQADGVPLCFVQKGPLNGR